MRDKLQIIQTVILRPRLVPDQIKGSQKKEISLFLIILYSFAYTLNQSQDLALLYVFFTAVAIAFGLIIGTVLYGQLLGWVTSLFSKEEVSNKIRLVIPYSFVPLIMGQLFVFVISNEHMAVVVNWIFTIWSLIILTILLSEVKKIKLIKALFSVITALLIWLTPFLLIYFVVIKFFT